MRRETETRRRFHPVDPPWISEATDETTNKSEPKRNYKKVWRERGARGEAPAPTCRLSARPWGRSSSAPAGRCCQVGGRCRLRRTSGCTRPIYECALWGPRLKREPGCDQRRVALSLGAVLRQALVLSLAGCPLGILKARPKCSKRTCEVGLGPGTTPLPAPEATPSQSLELSRSIPPPPRRPRTKLQGEGPVPDTPSHPTGWTRPLRVPSGPERLGDGAEPHSAPGLNDQQRAGAQEMFAE